MRTDIKQALTRVAGWQEYEAELQAAEAELRDEEAKARQAGAALEEAQAELGELRQQAGEMAALEEQYWHAANDLGLALRAHSQQRTSLQRKASHTHCMSDALRPTLNHCERQTTGIACRSGARRSTSPGCKLPTCTMTCSTSGTTAPLEPSAASVWAGPTTARWNGTKLMQPGARLSSCCTPWPRSDIQSS